MSNRLMMFVVGMVLATGMTGCGEKTPSEKASDAKTSAREAVNNAAKATGTAVNDAAKATGTAVNDAAKATGTAVNDAVRATGAAVNDAAKATGEYLTQSKDTDVKAAQDTLNGIEQKWQDLLAKATPTTDEAKADLQKVKDQMAQTLADVKARLVEAKDADADAWQQNVKPALNAAVQKAQKLYDDTVVRFGSK